MSLRKRRALSGFPLAVLLVAGLALARAPQDSGVELPFSKQAALTSQETVARAREYRTKMQEAVKTVQRLADEANKKKDVIRLNCVNDKLSQIKGHLAVADKSFASLDQAVQRNDVGERQHEFTRLTILSQKVETLRTEAMGCVGEDIPIVGLDKVIIEIDPSIPQEDPTQQPIPTLEPVPRPVEASPTA